MDFNIRKKFQYGRSIENKNIFSKHDLHVLFISFFSKMDTKKNYLTCYNPLKNFNMCLQIFIHAFHHFP